MTDQIIPVQCDISGMALFQRTQTVEVIEPAAKSSSESKPVTELSSRDSLNLSRPVKKRLEQKTSYFAAQLPAPAMPRQQELIQQSYSKKELKQTDSDLELSRRGMPSGFYDLMEQAETAYRQRLQSTESTRSETGSHQRPFAREDAWSAAADQKALKPGMLFSLFR